MLSRCEGEPKIKNLVIKPIFTRKKRIVSNNRDT